MEGGSRTGRPITKQDFYEDGLTGEGWQRPKKARELLKRLGLPEHLTTNAMVTLCNTMLTYEEYREAVSSL